MQREEQSTSMDVLSIEDFYLHKHFPYGRLNICAFQKQGMSTSVQQKVHRQCLRHSETSSVVVRRRSLVNAAVGVVFDIKTHYSQTNSCRIAFHRTVAHDCHIDSEEEESVRTAIVLVRSRSDAVIGPSNSIKNCHCHYK